MSRMSVFCQTTFEGFHRWPEAPAPVEFLALRHRHIFHVELHVWVSRTNRQCEFILLKRAVDEHVKRVQASPNCETWSCEDWCLELRSTFANVVLVQVSEDGENGARWEAAIECV